MLTCCAHIHGELVVHCLRIESLSIEVCKCSGNSLKALCCFLHGGLLSQNHRAVFDVAMNLKMSTQAAECECHFVLELRWNGVPARGSPDLCFGGLWSKVDLSGGCCDNSNCLQQVLRFDPQVPVVQVGKEFGA